jgi:hypothetical protein
MGQLFPFVPSAFLCQSDHIRITGYGGGGTVTTGPPGRFFPRCSPQVSVQITFRGCRLIV